nr:hypothetical protein [Tanacetum cinerariifolium]
MPLILKKWTPDANIMKEDVCKILVWVKFHDITITVFREDGLSVIATKLGNPLMLDSYMAAMCTNSWGKVSNAKAMVELQADFELKDTIVVVVPKFFGDGYTITILVEYEWATPKCSSCHVFSHGSDECSKKIVSDVFLVMVETGNKAFTSGEQEEGQRSTPLVERINAFEKQPLEWKCVLVDDNGKPPENVNYSSNQGSEDEVDSVDNEMTSYSASKLPMVCAVCEMEECCFLLAWLIDDCCGASGFDCVVTYGLIWKKYEHVGDTFGTSNEERADIVGKESEGLNSSPNGIASYPSVSFATLIKDGLSVISTKLGNPLMLDSYTAAMCTNSWGRASNARVMVELQADFELKDTTMVVVPKFFGDEYTMSTILVEY